MMRLPVFDYYAPGTVAEAVALKAQYGADAMYVAGGTDLYPKMKRRQVTPPVLIDLSQVTELRQGRQGSGNQGLLGAGEQGSGGAQASVSHSQLTIDNSQFIIPSGLTLTEIASHPVIGEQYPALAQAAALAASPALRNSGTLGGNLCLDTRCNYYDQSYSWRKALGFCLKKDGFICQVARSSPRCVAVASSDCAPAVIALGAAVRLVGPDGTRTIAAEALYRDDGADHLAKSADEILTAVHLPTAVGWRSCYWKLRRRGAIDFPVLGVAAAVRLADDGRCLEVRLVLSAVGSRPLSVPADITAPLLDRTLTAALIEEVAAAAARLVKPLDNTDMQAGYRKKMARVYIARSLAEAFGLVIP
jgi:4-hydroxybenzoyl-CoA reductase subunit beta